MQQIRVPDGTITYEPAPPLHGGSKKRRVSALLHAPEGQVILRRDADTKEEALNRLLIGWQRLVEATSYTLVEIRHYGATAILFPVPDGFWTYGLVGHYSSSLLGVSMIFDTRIQAEREARKRLAWLGLDSDLWNIEETASVFTHPDDRRQFLEEVAREQRRLSLTKEGWTHQEAQYLLDGLTHLIAPERLAEMPASVK